MRQGAHEIVQNEFDVIHLFVLRGSHHELPWSMQLMAGLFGLTNGATVFLFPGSHSPLAMVVLNINDAQTRKSNVFVQLHDLALAADEHSAKLYARAREEHRAHSEATQVSGPGCLVYSPVRSVFRR